MKRLIFVFLLIIGVPLAHADISELKKIVSSSEELMDFGVCIFEVDEGRYLTSMGISTIKGNDKKNILNARKTAKIKAKRGLVKFIAGEDTSVEETLVVEIKKTNENGVVKKSRKEKFTEIIKQKSQMAMVDIQDIGYWKDPKYNEYYYVLAIKIQ